MTFKILVIDDDEEVVEYIDLAIEKSLVDKEFKITECYDGEEAVVQLTDEKWDLITLDIKMPGLDGISIVENILPRSFNNKTPVLLMSGFVGMTHDRQFEKAYENVMIFPKPFEIEKLGRLVKLIFEGKKLPKAI